jgi:hypothetical protein
VAKLVVRPEVIRFLDLISGSAPTSGSKNELPAIAGFAAVASGCWTFALTGRIINFLRWAHRELYVPWRRRAAGAGQLEGQSRNSKCVPTGNAALVRGKNEQ